MSNVIELTPIITEHRFGRACDALSASIDVMTGALPYLEDAMKNGDTRAAQIIVMMANATILGMRIK